MWRIFPLCRCKNKNGRILYLKQTQKHVGDDNFAQKATLDRLTYIDDTQNAMNRTKQNLLNIANANVNEGSKG